MFAEARRTQVAQATFRDIHMFVHFQMMLVGCRPTWQQHAVNLLGSIFAGWVVWEVQKWPKAKKPSNTRVRLCSCLWPVRIHDWINVQNTHLPYLQDKSNRVCRVEGAVQFWPALFGRNLLVIMVASTQTVCTSITRTWLRETPCKPTSGVLRPIKLCRYLISKLASLPHIQRSVLQYPIHLVLFCWDPEVIQHLSGQEHVGLQ